MNTNSKHSNRLRKIGKAAAGFVSAAVISALFLLISCSEQAPARQSIAVFVPGVVAGNPVYEMLTEGVSQAVKDYNAKKSDEPKATLSIIEAGTNQAEWSTKLIAISAIGDYDLIISSNPSLPDLASPLTSRFPKQKYLILDGYLEGNANIATVRYNQREQAYLTGYAAALVTEAPASQMKYANKQKKIALVAAQEYPVMNNVILPSYIEGAQAVDKDIDVEFRIVGNWYDAAKGADIARTLYAEGVDVILPIAGGASQGVIAAAKELGFYIAWFDDNGFSKAPGYVISSSVMEQKKTAYEQTLAYLENKLEFGTAKTLGIKDGYVDFVLDDPAFIESVPENIRTALQEAYDSIRSGALVLPVQN